MLSRNRRFLLPCCLTYALFCCLTPFVSAEPVLLAPSISTIAQKFLADRQKSESPSTPAPQSFSQSENPFACLKITLSPTTEISPLPMWAKAPVEINKESSLVEIPIPALAEQSEIENFAITINFYDMGDGGPLVEGIKQDGERTLICSGLGINGPALGLNSRTISIPADLALDGGKIIVSHTGRFEQLHSIIVRPGRTAMTAVLSEKFFPAIVDESTMIEQNLANGALPSFKKGYMTHDRITSAELAAPIEQLSDSLEFAFDLTALPEATIFRTEIQGLDLEAHIDVELNGTLIGPLNITSFQLDSPEFIPTLNNDPHTSPFQLAGWRSAYFYIPTYLWKEKKTDLIKKESVDKESADGKNHLVLIVKQGPRSSGSKIHLKNSCLEVLHAVAPEDKK